MYWFCAGGLVVKLPGVLSKVQMLNLVLGVGVFAPLFQLRVRNSQGPQQRNKSVSQGPRAVLELRGLRSKAGQEKMFFGKGPRKGVLLSVIPKSCALLKTLFLQCFQQNTAFADMKECNLKKKNKHVPKTRGCRQNAKKKTVFLVCFFCFLVFFCSLCFCCLCFVKRPGTSHVVTV